MKKLLQYTSSVIFLVSISFQAVKSQITVIDIVPNSRSFDSTHDSEPNLAINPANPRTMAASAFTSLDRYDLLSSPIYVSLDGGNEWFLKRTIPENYWPRGSTDITLRFNGKGDKLYVAVLPGLSMHLSFQLLSIPTLELQNDADYTPNVLNTRAYVDQPYIQATTILGGDGRHSDKVYVGNNDNFLNPTPTSATNIATVDFLPEALSCSPHPDFERVEKHPTSENLRADESAVRTAVHPSGVVYAVFYRIKQRDIVAGVADRADVVIVRDDRWASSCPRFESLTDGPLIGPPMIGKRIVEDSIVPYNSNLGANRLVGSHLSIAVDPTNPAIVYVAWADSSIVDRTYTLHVRRSSDSGQNWSDGDIITIKRGINPALAVNTYGKVAFLYQQMITVSNNDYRWETHLARSSDNGISWTDDTLSRFLQSSTPFTQSHNELVYLGDYLHLMAVGKDFYGIFSASNYPDSANFPRRIIYQRNADFQRHVLLANDNSTIVHPSIDPFFFHVTELDSTDDFYVRDFTNSPSDFDNGVEPSTDPHFCSTSDLWNMKTNGDPGLNDDPPPTGEDPQGAGISNFGFVRVHRKKPGPAIDVNLRFLFSEFGISNPYVVAGDTVIHFNDGDPFQTLRTGYNWHLPSSNSSHNCLAIEICTPADPFIPPGLNGLSPGWDNGTDLMVFNDNNKAQRNMGLFTTTGTGSGAPMSTSGAPGTGTMSMTTAVMYAVIHNPTLHIADMQIRPVINPIAKRKPSASVVGGKETSVIKSNGDIIIKKMNPGESRFLKISYAVPRSKEGKNFSYTYNQIKNDVVVNAFTILNQYTSIDKVIQENFRYEGAVFRRITALYKDMDTALLLLDYNKNINEKKPDANDYQAYLKKNVALIRSVARQLISQNKDAFNLSAAINALQKEIKGKDVAKMADAHLSLLNTIDAFLTSQQLEKGNIADILQTMRLQSSIVHKISSQDRDSSVGHLLELSDSFIAAFEKRSLTIADYPNQLKNMLNDLKNLAVRFGKADNRLMSSLKRMEEKSDPAELQGQHIKFLLLLKEILNQK